MTESNERVSTAGEACLFLQLLKKSTARLHELLESNSLLSSIMSAGVTVHDYYCYLRSMCEVTEVYEKIVLPKLAKVLQKPAQTQASDIIKADLENIKYKSSVNTIPAAFVVKQEMSIPFALGFSYVMEGSKLGGRVIFKHIQQTLGFTEVAGAAFIADYGNNTGALWKEFLSQFSWYIIQNDGENAAIQGANYAFTSIYDFFNANRIVYEV